MQNDEANTVVHVEPYEYRIQRAVSVSAETHRKIQRAVAEGKASSYGRVIDQAIELYDTN